MKVQIKMIVGFVFFALAALSFVVSLFMSMTDVKYAEYSAYLCILLMILGQRQIDLIDSSIRNRVIAELSLLREIRRTYMNGNIGVDEDLLAASRVATNEVISKNHPLYREHSRDSIEHLKDCLLKRANNT